MLKLNQLTGFGAGRARSRPASYVFNGTDERLQRVLATSGGSTTVFTWSAWMKLNAGALAVQTPIFMVHDFAASPTGTRLARLGSPGVIGDLVLQDLVTAAVQYSEYVPNYDNLIAENSWHHLVVRFDSANTTSDDRVRYYLNGSFIADTSTQPALNEPHHMFTNGFTHNIGFVPNIWHPGKFAFIDLLDGVSADAAAFAFTNGSTWTRKPYAGSYGTHGFCLDGSDGFNDVSGHGQHFTGSNMDASNLDLVDLPPHAE